MTSELAVLVGRWCDAAGIAPELRPAPAQLVAGFGPDERTCRSGIDPDRLASWDRRFGFALPESLKAWLRLSDGFYCREGPLVHPLSGIGPMVPFARIPGLVIQPESWFELGNPNLETVCIDLAYRWPGGESPLFTSGDDERHSPPRLIAPGFSAWFLRLLHRGGAEFWFEPGFEALGDPWAEHRRRVAMPTLPDGLRGLVPRARMLIDRGLDDRTIAVGLGVTPPDVEALVRHVQHARGDYAAMGAETGS